MRRSPFVPLALLAGCALEAPAPVTPAPTPTASPSAAPSLALVPNACGVIDEPADHERPRATDDDPWHRKTEPAGVCSVHEKNIDRAAAAILAAPRGKPGEVNRPAWDRKAKPERMDAVARRFALGPAERALLAKNGFVVPAARTFASYTEAFHEIYLSELPLYVSVDSVLHAVFRGNDSVAEQVERARLAPLLTRTLSALHCALPAAAAEYPEETARDLDVYLTVARTLLGDKAVPAMFEGDAEPAAALVARAIAAEGMERVTLFGRERLVDFTQYTPRGHYTPDSGLVPYFRAAMWLSRLELNLVSRSSRSSAATELADPRETPREAIDALALADLAARAGVMEGVQTVERAFALFAGKREDVSLSELANLRQKAGIGSLREAGAFERFKAALGDGYQRSVRIHYMPMGTSALPAITTFLGPRVVADTQATHPLLEPETPGRHVLGAADMGYALGHDRAASYLQGEVKRYPTLPARLADARAIARRPSNGEDLYTLWYRAILGLAERPNGALPSFMAGEAFADLRLDSAITAFGQIRHNAVLFAAQGYDQGGCEIPDAYLEPAPAVYEALVAYAERGAAALQSIDPKDGSEARGYFTSLGRTLRVLAAISRDELSGKPLSDEEKRFLSMVVEMHPGSSSGPPTYSGWYFDLYPSTADALAGADFVADYFTSGYECEIAYAGATAPRLGVFVVDSGGAPRVMVGPVARGYEVHGPLGARLDDERARKLPKVNDPWAASYTTPAPPEPDVSVELDPETSAERPVFVVEAKRALGPVTLEILDHHRRPLQSVTRSVGAGKTRFVFKGQSAENAFEAVHLAVGQVHAWQETRWYGGAPLTLGKRE